MNPVLAKAVPSRNQNWAYLQKRVSFWTLGLPPKRAN
jgi:hypothetical protein